MPRPREPSLSWGLRHGGSFAPPMAAFMMGAIVAAAAYGHRRPGQCNQDAHRSLAAGRHRKSCKISCRISRARWAFRSLAPCKWRSSKVDGMTYSSVMITGLRQTSTSCPDNLARFAVLGYWPRCASLWHRGGRRCLCNEGHPQLAHDIPVEALLTVLLRSEVRPNEECQ